MQFPFLYMCFWETEAISCNTQGQVVVLQVRSVVINVMNLRQQSDSSLFAVQLTVAKSFQIQSTGYDFIAKRIHGKQGSPPRKVWGQACPSIMRNTAW